MTHDLWCDTIVFLQQIRILMQQAKSIIQQADVVVLFTGAGMAADSGVPTFRGYNGVAETYPVLEKKNVTYASLTTQRMFDTNPDLAWAFHGHCYNVYKDTIPHAGYGMLLEMMQKKLDYFVVTSNVDSAHQKSGLDASKVYEVHGRIHTLQCTQCDAVWKDENRRFDVDVDTFTLHSELPRCKCCALARPNFMMFGDTHFNKAETQEQARRFTAFMQKYDKGNHKIACIEIGAGETVATIRMMGEFIHDRVPGATLIRVNPIDTNKHDSRIVTVKSGALDAIKNLTMDFAQ